MDNRFFFLCFFLSASGLIASLYFYLRVNRTSLGAVRTLRILAVLRIGIDGGYGRLIGRLIGWFFLFFFFEAIWWA